MRVVLAEDSVLLREGLIRLLGSADMEVVAAGADADELLRAVDEHRPDLEPLAEALTLTAVETAGRDYEVVAVSYQGEKLGFGRVLWTDPSGQITITSIGFKP